MARFAARLLPQRTRDTIPKRILLVQFDHLGDAVITTAMFPKLKQRFPDARIDVLAAPWNRAVFDAAPEVEKVSVCAHNRFASKMGLAWIPATIAWGWRLRRQRYDLVIDVRGEFPHNVLLWLTGAPRRLGWSSGGGGFLLTHKATFVVGRAELDSRAALLDQLGIRSQERLQPEFHPSAAATRSTAAAWKEFGPTLERPRRIVLHVSAGTSAKRWPAEHWRQLVLQLSSEQDILVALVGTAADGPTAQAILGDSPRLNIADWTGRFTVDELAAVLQQADVLVGADSGPAHLAAAVGTPVVALFSGTNSVEQWQPRGNAIHVLRANVPCSPCHLKTCPLAAHRCMRDIRPEHVVEALNQLLPECPGSTLLAASPRNTKGLRS